ncbi:vanadium-dependent haloperoxidase [soil metagenome]
MRSQIVAAGARFVIVIVMLAGVPGAAHAGENVVRRWNSAALEAVRRSTLGPPAVARALAIVHTCMYDAWAASDPIAVGVQYHVKDPSAGAEEHKARAVSYAAYRALLNLFPAQRPLFDGVMGELGLDPLDQSDPDSVRGVAAAQAGLDAREFDRANQGGNYADHTGYVPVNPADVLLDPNRWQPLTGANGTVQRFALPHWGLVEPFALHAPDQFRPPPPARYPHGLYTKQALAVAQMSARLGDREKAMAGYWADGPRTETPPGHWSLLAQFVSERDAHTMEQDVKLFFALTNSLMDASIAAWDAKRHYDSPRPVTTIHFLLGGRPIHAWAGPYQGTQLISGDRWQSYLPTPPFAEYVSGHSTFSAAAAEILRSFTGSDAFGAQVTIEPGSSPIEPGVVPAAAVTLAWRTFSEAADEAGLSRRYGGIHFEDGDLMGRRMGRQIGRLVWQTAQSYFDGTAQVP